MAYRPWGTLDWALQLASPRRWSFVGALGTEQRSLGAWRWLRELDVVGLTHLLEILDSPSRHTIRARQLLVEREQEFRAAGGHPSDIHRSLRLMAELHRLDTIARSIAATGGIGGQAPLSLILDITSLPKRYFFPFLRLFEKTDSIRDLVITYTSPESYVEGEPLSENATDWLNLPGFQGKESASEMLIVSVGFMVESLQNHIATIKKCESVKMLIPFPAPLPVLRRTWDSVYCIESNREPGKFEDHRVDTADMPEAFDRIVSFDRNPDVTLAFAPFGPKPISAAICLFAAQRNCTVYYPQPRIYHPDYSKGIGKVEGKDAVFAYWIKHGGEPLYRLP